MNTARSFRAYRAYRAVHSTRTQHALEAWQSRYALETWRSWRAGEGSRDTLELGEGRGEGGLNTSEFLLALQRCLGGFGLF